MGPKQISPSSPEQALHHRYHALLDPRQSLDSEQQLMLALLTDAAALIIRNDPAEHHAAAQAWDWVLGFGQGCISFEDASDRPRLSRAA
jgi:hypothetical protein